MWNFIHNNSGDIQTIISVLGLCFTIIGIFIAIIAIIYAKKQIELFLAQRSFELKLLIQQQLVQQMNVANKILSDINELKKIHNSKMKQGFKDKKLNETYKEILPPVEIAYSMVEKILNVLELNYEVLINNKVSVEISYYEEQIKQLLQSGEGLQTQSKVVDNLLLRVSELANKDV